MSQKIGLDFIPVNYYPVEKTPKKIMPEGGPILWVLDVGNNVEYINFKNDVEAQINKLWGVKEK